jgi:uncharacterized protein
MEYRQLGRTKLRVSVLGVGCGYLSCLDRDEGVKLLERAFDLGINYFDGRYGDSNLKLRPLLARHRSDCIVVCKTRDSTAEGALNRVDEDLIELDTDYIDIYLLRTYNQEMLQEYLVPGGAMEGLLRARDMGKVRYVGLSGHTDLTALADGVETGLVDVLLFPLNLVRQEALESLVPVAQQYDVGLTVMKPVSVGMLPAEISLRWLATQPIHTMVPGMTTMEHLESDVAAVERRPSALSLEEKAQIEKLRRDIQARACHQCESCEPCPEGIKPIFRLIYSDVWYNHYRNMGLQAFLEHPWAPWAQKGLETHFARRLADLRACTRCGLCEERCPHGVNIMDLFERMLEDHPPLIEALKERGWATQFAHVPSPYA